MNPMSVVPARTVKAVLSVGEVFFQALREPIGAQFIRIRRQSHPTNGEQCVVCRESLQEGDIITLCLTNQRLFPNCMAHQACVQWDDLPRTAQRIMDDWTTAQRFAHWF